MENVVEDKVKEEVIDETIKDRQEKYENAVELNPSDFYAKQITHGQGESAVMLTKIAMLAGLGMIEKYGLNVELNNLVAQSQYEVVANISDHNTDFFAKAFFHKSDPHEPIGVMFGDYIPDIRITVSNILYVKPEYRVYDLESRLIDNFTWWSKHTKKAVKVFIERVEEV